MAKEYVQSDVDRRNFIKAIMATAVAATATRGETPEKIYRSTEISVHVKNALATLSAQQRVVFILRHYQDLKLSEIAVMMNCAEGTVKRYLYLAIRKLREQLRCVFES